MLFSMEWSTLCISVSSFANTSDFSLNMTLTFYLSDVVNSDRSMVLTTLCWCSLLDLFGGVTLGSFNIWSGGATVVLFTDGDLHEVDCLTCNSITDLTYSIIPTLVLLRNTISWPKWMTDSQLILESNCWCPFLLSPHYLLHWCL